MKLILLKLSGRASDLVDIEPLIALFLGAALLAVFLSAFVQSKSDADPPGKLSLLWTLYGHFTHLARALMLVALLVATISVLRSYLRQAVSNFQRSHGRVTQANYDAAQLAVDAAHEEVGIAVVVEVGHGRRHRVPGAAQRGGVGHVREPHPALVPEEPVRVAGRVLLEAGDGGAVREEQVDASIPVVIEGGHAPRHRLDEVLARGGAVPEHEVEAGLSGHVAEADGGGGRRRGHSDAPVRVCRPSIR